MVDLVTVLVGVAFNPLFGLRTDAVLPGLAQQHQPDRGDGNTQFRRDFLNCLAHSLHLSVFYRQFLD